MNGNKGACIALSAVLSLVATVGLAEPGAAVLTGRVLDPSGLGIPAVTVTLVATSTGASRTAVTDRAGVYRLADLPPGAYSLEAAYPGFAPYSEQVAVAGTGPQQVDIKLQLQATKESVTVAMPASEVYAPLSSSQHETGDVDRARSANAADLLGDSSGVDLQQGGSIAAIPLLHGMGDERTKLLVNGMTLSSACPNHMNPPLSYIDPSNVAKAYVTAGITPVSLGGDSIAGTVSVDSAQPTFAKAADEWHTEGVLSSFYRSNGTGYGAALAGSLASRHLSFGYSGAWDNTGDYDDGSGHKITSTYAQTANNSASFAAQGAGNLIVIEAGLHNTPYQGFPNQQMDMTRNHGEFVNVRYSRDLHWGVLETRAY
jgi:iron complex outermembrane receptor protein